MGLGGKNILINKMNKTNKMAAKVFTCLLMDSTDSSGGARKGRREIKRKNGAGDKMSIALIRRRRRCSLSLSPSLSHPPTGVLLGSAEEIMAPLKRRRLAQPSVIGASRAPKGRGSGEEFGELNGGPLKKGRLNPGAPL